jgi:deoxyribose-phosphate aldolase
MQPTPLLIETIQTALNQHLGKKPPPAVLNTDGVREGLAGYLDHTLLKAQATAQDFKLICEEARAHGFASVCVNSAWIGFVKAALFGSKVKPISVVGFPLGAMSTEAKAFETQFAIQKGAEEIDMVISVGHLKAKDFEYVYQDIATVVQAAAGVPVKVILETCLLSESEKIAACVIAKASGAHFVKTSTGFSTGGATLEDVALMRAVVGEKMGVKASGGIKTRSQALAMITAGANRLGTSSSVELVSEDLVSEQSRDKVATSQDNY